MKGNFRKRKYEQLCNLCYFSILAIFICIILFLAGVTLYSMFRRLQPLSLKDIAEYMSAAISFLAVVVAISEYHRHLEAEKTALALKYNERYTTDKNIKKVLQALLNDTPNPDEDIFEKEMFLRFFEELDILLDKNLLDKKETYNLFSYYALEANKQGDNFIKGYTPNNNQMDNWVTFKAFCKKMKEEEKKQA